LVLSEVTGGNAFIYDFTFGEFDDVPSSNVDLYFSGYYDGNLAHTVKLQQWNYVTGGGQWENVTANPKDFPDAVSEQNYEFFLFDNPNYISSGNIQIRIIHTSPGNPTHQFHINKLYLQAGGPSSTPSQTPSESPSQTPSQTSSRTVSATPSLTPSRTVSATPSFTVSQTPSTTPSRTVSETLSQTPSVSATPSETPSRTPSSTASASPSGSPTYATMYRWTGAIWLEVDVIVVKVP
jgi:hypothetical protein